VSGSPPAASLDNSFNLAIGTGAVKLDNEGFTMREIAEEMGISAVSVCRALKSYRRAIDPVVL